MPNDHTVAVLRTWGQLGRRLAQSEVLVVRGWVPASRMITTAVPFFKALAGELNSLLDQSDKLLEPLADPLRTDFGVHRWLRADREEAYSDWLAWIVDKVSAEHVLRMFAISRLFPGQHFQASGPIRTKREFWVPQGHVGQQGRLDLVIRFDHAMLVVEIKLDHADEADTAKQHGYAKWVKKQGSETAILLATGGDEETYAGNFRLLRWADLCLALRGIARDLLDQKQHVLATMILAFVGAVEQNLLGFSFASVSDPQQSRFRTFDPSIVRHLTRWVKEISK